MQKHGICWFFTCWSALICSAVNGQTVSVSQEPLKPYFAGTEGDSMRARGASTTPPRNPSPYTTTFAVAYRGPQGSTSGNPAQDTSALLDYNFPSLNFLFSAAARIVPTEGIEPGKIDDKVVSLSELRRINANIRIRGLDENRKPFAAPRQSAPNQAKEPEISTKTNADSSAGPHVVILGISPTETQMTQRESTLSKLAQGVERFVTIPLFTSWLTQARQRNVRDGYSGLVSSFSNYIPYKDVPTQVAYLASEDEFGWTWQDAPAMIIDGIHQCSAFFMTHKNVAYLQVHIDLVTDWRSFGAWVKAFDYVIAIPLQNITP